MPRRVSCAIGFGVAVVCVMAMMAGNASRAEVACYGITNKNFCRDATQTCEMQGSNYIKGRDEPPPPAVLDVFCTNSKFFDGKSSQWDGPSRKACETGQSETGARCAALAQNVECGKVFKCVSNAAKNGCVMSSDVVEIVPATRYYDDTEGCRVAPVVTPVTRRTIITQE